jgi:UDP-N-acetylglucosamine:LPS N-acetylglucosamine transferase
MRGSIAYGPGSQPPYRALLLSGDLGAGHKITAEAVSAILDQAGWYSSVVDCMALLGSGGDAVGQAVFRRLVGLPGVYDAFHFSCLRPGTSLAVAADRAARRRIVPKLAESMSAHCPDVALAVFATGASAAAELARRGQGPPVVAFCTDVVPHRMWVHDGVAAYLVICDAAAEWVRSYQPHAEVVVVPRPVRSGFRQPPSQSKARRALGISPRDPCVLLMSGGWGLGPIAEAASALADAGVQVLAVAGSNATLHNRLVGLAQSRPALHPFGFTTQVPALMAASDVVITASGVTCSEARAVGRALLLIDVVPGHGRENLQHELELGNAAVTATDPAVLTAATLAAIDRATIAPPQDPTEEFRAGLTDVFAKLGLANRVIA